MFTASAYFYNEFCIWNQYMYLLPCICCSLCSVIFHNYYYFCFNRALRTSILHNYVLQRQDINHCYSIIHSTIKWFINNLNQFMLIYHSLSNNIDMDLYFVHNCNMNWSDDSKLISASWDSLYFINLKKRIYCRKLHFCG